ncbi:MAG TPA: GNAT family N-acetyltransferase [Clostridia bacterium]|nr:GNAT family N-acetyltransferase [Clostridia bacterium]
MYEYFHKTKLDEVYYKAHLESRLPHRILDAHAHFNLLEHVKNVSEETIKGDWALECGMLMTYEDAREYTSVMFPDKDWSFVALPWPLREADTEGNNAYIASLIEKHRLIGLYTVRPEYSIKSIEQAYLAGNFSGFKPYPYMASAVKGAQVSIFDFMPHSQFALADRLHAPVLMHLPRAGRLPDKENIKEIRIILNTYPNVKLVIAHFGRCFQHEYFIRALDELGEDVHRLWFDTAAVLNPKVLTLAFERLDYHRILFGTDLPIFLWHGTREWDANGYYNLCREKFSWNTNKYPEKAESYTYFIYEQMKNILDIIDGNSEITNAVFFDNAIQVYADSAYHIRQVDFVPKRHMQLLLIADPDEDVVREYINRCTIYEYTENNRVLGIAATLELNDALEVKNIAVDPSSQRGGVGSKLLKHIQQLSKQRLIVGTADASAEAQAFYIKNGFKVFGKLPRFFVDNYAEPVYDEGRLCKDMILLEWMGE